MAAVVAQVTAVAVAAQAVCNHSVTEESVFQDTYLIRKCIDKIERKSAKSHLHKTAQK